ncbi:hypothetical protein KN63_01780 [Smithella sp. F21]|nr:hypothetical protein KN63_01780 [Smithella sp. F21]
MDRLNRSSINMLSSAAGYIVPMFVNLLTIPFLLSGLGDAAYGIQSLVAVIIGYLTFMEMGLDLPVTKLLAEDRAKNDTKAESYLLSTTLQLYGIIGIIGMTVIILLSDVLVLHIFKVPQALIPAALTVFQLAGIGFLGSVGLSWGRAVAMGMQRFDLSYSVSAIVSSVGALGGLGAVYAGYGVIGYVTVRVVLSLMAGPACWLLTYRALPDFRFRWGLHRLTLHRVKAYLGYGILNRVTSSLFSRLDQTLIGAWLGVAAAGVYSVPFMLVNSLGYMIAYMLGFIFPMASELHGLGQMDRLRDIFTRATRFMAALAGLIYIPLFVFGDLILEVWVPGIAQQATSVLRLLALSAYISALTASLTNNIVIGVGKIRQFTVYANIRGLVLGLLCILLIHPFGLKGAGWALVLAGFVDVIYLSKVLHNYLNMSRMELFKSAYLKPLILGVGLAFVSFACRPLAASWVGLGCVFAGLSFSYIIIGYWFGVYGETEKRAVIGILNMISDSFNRA